MDISWDLLLNAITAGLLLGAFYLSCPQPRDLRGINKLREIIRVCPYNYG